MHLLRPLIATCALFSVLAPARAAFVSPSEPLIRYVGRFDTADAAGPCCSWSASTVSFTVSGGGTVSARFSEKGKNHWQVVVDGSPAGVIALQPGEHEYPVVADLPAGKHRIELVKRTEAHVGLTQFLGLTIDDSAKLVATPARARAIEVIGDSISCGYGNEAPNKETHFSPETENAWMAYGAIAARAVDADYVCVAWSGRKLWPDNTLVSIYDQIAPPTLKSVWSFSGRAPDVVVVNLATNDFRKANPDEAGWVAAYVKFIGEIRTRYPNAPIYCAVGSMMSDWPTSRKPRTTVLGYIAKVIEQTNVAGVPPVRLVDLGVQNEQQHGIGADWHPSVKTHEVMAEKLVAAFKADLGW